MKQQGAASAQTRIGLWQPDQNEEIDRNHTNHEIARKQNTKEH
jgi:hypothetical protein